MRRPKVAEVNNWTIVEDMSNEIATVWEADNIPDFFKLTSPAHATKLFYGETAWQDAQRLSSDLFFKVRVAS